MSATDVTGPEPEGDDVVAAEYVLGVQPAAERQAVSRRIESEPVFGRLVERWEEYFAPLAYAYAEVQAPASVKIAVDRRLFSTSASLRPAEVFARPGLWASLAFWRGLAVAALAGLALLIVIPLANPPVVAPQTRLVASLAADGSDVRFLAVYDSARGEVALSRISGTAAADRAFELWMIEGSNAPVSVGLIPSGDAVNVAVAQATRDKLAAGAVLAVSLEPSGGSPTGQPTGPVVAAGDLKSI